MPTNLIATVKSIYCIHENDVNAHDEPYVLAGSVDLTSGLVPNVDVTLYGPWAEAEEGQTNSTFLPPPNTPQPVLALLAITKVLRKPFFGPKAIAKLEDMILVAAVMEHDHGSPGSHREIMKQAMVASLAASTGKPRADRVSRLRDDVRDGIDVVAGNIPDLGPAYNPDDRIGPVQEVKFTADQIKQAASTPVPRSVNFYGNSGTYRVTFELRRA